MNTLDNGELKKTPTILGLSFFYHDSAACLLKNGAPVALAEEERFTRKKNDSAFPEKAIEFVLRQGDVLPAGIDWVVFYEKPFWKLERILKVALATFPWAPLVFAESLKHIFLDKLWIRELIASKLGIDPGKVLFSGHHLSHAASAYFCSPWEKAAFLTVDGVGEWATTTLGIGAGNQLRTLKEIRFPHSLGLLYSAFTAYLGFEINEGEYKVMGMAPYGRPTYVEKVKKLIHIEDNGFFRLNLEYFLFHRSLEKSYSRKFVDLFGKPRDPKSKFFTRSTGWPSYFGPKPEGAEFLRQAEEQECYADVAASLQAVTEEVLIKLAREAKRLTGLDTLCLAGGVALNCVANWKILEQSGFKELYIQPAAGDAGGALGAALAVQHCALGQEKRMTLAHAYWGEVHSDAAIQDALRDAGLKHEHIVDEAKLLDTIADLLAAGNVIGYFHGGFEWGPRALGHRSIIADPRRAEMKDIVNTKIKFREPYRPFAPSVLAEHAEEYFEMPEAKKHLPARFMLYVVPVKKEKRDIVPAITHVDGTARPQLVFKETALRYWNLIDAFYKKTGVPLILNTSFNLKGEPIVNTPENAINTFLKSGMDYLVLENYIVSRPVTASQTLWTSFAHP